MYFILKLGIFQASLACLPEWKASFTAQIRNGFAHSPRYKHTWLQIDATPRFNGKAKEKNSNPNRAISWFHTQMLNVCNIYIWSILMVGKVYHTLSVHIDFPEWVHFCQSIIELVHSFAQLFGCAQILQCSKEVSKWWVNGLYPHYTPFISRL